MAFMLIALVVFFVIVGLFYFSFQFRNVKNNANDVFYAEAVQITNAIKATPEFSWTVDSCHACVDFDKVFALKDQKVYSGFWGTPFLKVRVLDGNTKDVECTRANYPECNSLLLVDLQEFYRAERAYVALCRTTGDGPVCKLGTISVGSKVK